MDNHLNPADISVAPGVVVNPERRRGKPTLAGTRITVEEVMSKLAADWSIDEVLRAWPHLTREQVLQAIAYATQLVRQQAAAGVTFDGDDDSGSEVLA